MLEALKVIFPPEPHAANGGRPAVGQAGGNSRRPARFRKMSSACLRNSGPPAGFREMSSACLRNSLCISFYKAEKGLKISPARFARRFSLVLTSKPMVFFGFDIQKYCFP